MTARKDGKSKTTSKNMKIVEMKPALSRAKPPKDFVNDFSNFCEKEGIEGVICIGIKKIKNREFIYVYCNELSYSQRVGMLKFAENQFTGELAE